jgi:two-component system sensor histidine kinase KdpD
MARLREGIDVVVGVVETHGRKEAEALLDGLAVIPRQSVDYKGHVLQEMDLDALLARRPQLALVDELAHTNAPGSRHPKRYMDVDELVAAGERVLACVRGDPRSIDVVRHAKRMADSLKAPWTAIHVETGRNLDMSETERDRIAEALRLAERLGAETVTLPGQDVADTIADYARDNNFTHIIIVQPPRSRWLDLLYGPVAQQLIRKAGGAGVHVLGRSREATGQQGQWRLPLGRMACADNARAYLGSLALTFLTAVLVSAIAYGL